MGAPAPRPSFANVAVDRKTGADQLATSDAALDLTLVRRVTNGANATIIRITAKTRLVLKNKAKRPLKGAGNNKIPSCPALILGRLAEIAGHITL
jgi:hypothetical protein